MDNFNLKKYLAEGRLYEENGETEIEISVRHAREAGDAFRDTQFSKMGEMTSTNSFLFKNREEAEEFVEFLETDLNIPEEEITYL
jgi:hypothetical protein